MWASYRLLELQERITMDKPWLMLERINSDCSQSGGLDYKASVCGKCKLQQESDNNLSSAKECGVGGGY